MIFFIQIYCSVVDPNTLNLDSDPDPELWPNSNPGFFYQLKKKKLKIILKKNIFI